MAEEQRDISSDQLRVAGDVNIDKVEVVSLYKNTSFSITNQVKAIEIYEDMFSPFTTGSIVVQDSLDLINALPFVGEEYLDIKLFTPTLDSGMGDDGIIQGRYFIYKMSERENVGEKSVIYQLHFISAEAVNDLNVKLSRGFEGKISDIIGTLVKDGKMLGTDKPLILEDTKSATKYVSNYWSVVENINFLTKQASNGNGSATYCFFENRQGFNFVSLDYLNEQKPSQVFNNGTANGEISPSGGSSRNIDEDFSKLLEFGVPHGFDIIDRVNSGTYASKLISHDMTTKRYKTVHYDYLSKFNEGTETRLNKFPITTPDVAARVNSTIFNVETANQVFSGFGDVSNIRVMQDRTSRMKQAEAFKVHVKVNGRTDYTVGQVVKLNITSPSPTSTSDTPEQTEDKMYSGNYIVSAINHSINKEKHECHMELIKDSLIFDLQTGKTS
jgi:hypothetical protein